MFGSVQNGVSELVGLTCHTECVQWSVFPLVVSGPLAKGSAMALSKTMQDALLSTLSVRPDSIHDYDREAERWLRGVPKRTCMALKARGLVDEVWWDTIGNYRAHLTDEGLRVHHELRDKDRHVRSVVREVASR